ncbi:MAG: hypothetical protein R2873_17345 [Caldilineaceae bacterium]
MLKRRITAWATILLVALLTLAGCAPSANIGADISVDPTTPLVVDLPAISINISETGQASLGNVPVAQLGRLVGLDLTALSVPQPWVDFLISGNIQHLQITNTADGLYILVNGERIPSIAYDGNSLQATADALSSLGMAVPMLDIMLPMVNKLGLGFVVHFPVAEGVAQIPLYVSGDGTAAALAHQAQQDFLMRVGASPRINLPVFYAPDGSWTVGNLTETEWSALTGLPFYALQMNPSWVNRLAIAGVAEISFSTDTAGIRLSINGNMLPTLTWGDGELLHLVHLADQTGLLEMMAPGMNMNEMLAVFNQLLPMVTTSDFDLTVHMPSAAMASRR